MDLDLDRLDFPEDIWTVADTDFEEYLKGVRVIAGDGVPPVDTDEAPAVPPPLVLSSDAGSSGSAPAQIPPTSATSELYTGGDYGEQPTSPSSWFPDADEEMGGAGSKKAPKKVSEQRKQNNRKAQQRYREKRKQAAADLEQKVLALTSQLEAMQGIQSQAARLNGENAELRAALAEQRLHMERLQDERKIKDECQAATEGRTGPCAEQLGLPKAVTSAQASQHRSQCATQMGLLLTAEGLPTMEYMPGDPRYDKPQLAEQLAQLRGEANKASMMMLSASNAFKCSKSADVVGAAHNCPLYRSRWERVIRDLNLSAAQEDAALAQRKQVLDSLRGIYAERQDLNIRTAGMLLPRPDPLKEYDGSVDSKLHCVERYGGKCVMAEGLQLAQVLDQLKSNLCQELKLVARLHACLVTKILTTGQAAVLFIIVQEDLIEPLHFCNLIAMKRNIIAVPKLFQAVANSSSSTHTGQPV